MEKYFKLKDLGIIDIITIRHYKDKCDPENNIEMVPDSDIKFSKDGNHGSINVYGVILKGEESQIDALVNCIKSKTMDK